MIISATMFVSTMQAQDNNNAVNKANDATTGLTIPKKKYAGKVDFTNAPQRKNNKHPLSDQQNTGKWKLLKSASDEFNDSKLDIGRWYPTNPKWKGRMPTYFHEKNTTLEKGNLVMRINKHGNEKLPDGFTHSAGFIVSKDAYLYGYFEARFKPNDSPWVTGFWLSNSDKEWWTEIDICENCPGVAANRHDLNSNVHVFRAPADKGNITKHIDSPAKYYIPFELQADFHTWGLEWNKEVIRFYIDGVMFREIENKYWHQPLHININNESNKWFGALPDDKRLNEEYIIDYLRVWQKR